MEYYETEREDFQRWKLNHESALAAHAQHGNTTAQLLEGGLSFALEAIRTAVLINGGAVVAMAAFIGATYNAPNGEVEPVRAALLLPAFLFAIGAVAAGLASECAYFTQLMYHEASDYQATEWDQPFIRDTASSKSKRWWGVLWHRLGVVMILGSYSTLVVGLVFAFRALG